MIMSQWKHGFHFWRGWWAEGDEMEVNGPSTQPQLGPLAQGWSASPSNRPVDKKGGDTWRRTQKHRQNHRGWRQGDSRRPDRSFKQELSSRLLSCCWSTWWGEKGKVKLMGSLTTYTERKVPTDYSKLHWLWTTNSNKSLACNRLLGAGEGKVSSELITIEDHAKFVATKEPCDSNSLTSQSMWCLQREKSLHPVECGCAAGSTSLIVML